MKHIKFLDKLFARLGYFPLTFLPIKQIPIIHTTLPFVTIGSCVYEKAIMELAYREGPVRAKEILIDKMRMEILTEAVKYIEITDCKNPIEIRAILRAVSPNKL